MDPALWQQHALANRLQSLLLLGLMGGFAALVGWLLWGPDGLVSVLVSVSLLLLLNPAVSPRLLMRMYRAERLSRASAPRLVAMVEALSRRAGLPRPPEFYY